MENLFSRKFKQGSGLDQFNGIYKEETDYELLAPLKTITVSRNFELPRVIDGTYNYFEDFDYAELVNLEPKSVYESYPVVYFDRDGFKQKFREYGGYEEFAELLHRALNFGSDVAYNHQEGVGNPYLFAFRYDTLSSTPASTDFNYKEYIEKQLDEFFNSADYESIPFSQRKMFSLIYMSALQALENKYQAMSAGTASRPPKESRYGIVSAVRTVVALFSDEEDFIPDFIKSLYNITDTEQVVFYTEEFGDETLYALLYTPD